MRYARTREGDMFISSTGLIFSYWKVNMYLINFVLAVLMSEVVKLITCLAIVYVQSGGIVQLIESLRDIIIRQPIDTLKVCVPSFVYVLQNNLLYLSASHLDAATYQVSNLTLISTQL